MELRQLETFLRVAEERNFTRAAERLSLTQPAVTRQILGLERELGTRLFERLGKEVRLTAGGRMLRGYATGILRLCDNARAAMSDIATGRGGDVTVGASNTLATYLLPPVLHRFRQCHPQVALAVATGASDQILDMVDADDVDLGLVTSDRLPSPLVQVPLCRYETVAVLPITHALAGNGTMPVQALSQEPLILMKRGSHLRGYVDRLLEGANIRPKVAMELDNVEVIKKMVETGLGISLVPAVAVRAEVADGRLAALDLGELSEPQRRVALVYRGDKYLSASIRAFMELLQAEVGVMRDE